MNKYRMTGQAFARDLFRQTAEIIEEKLAVDLMLQFALFRVKALEIETAAGSLVDDELERFVWITAARDAYREAVREHMTALLTAWKKQAPVGKRLFNRAIGMLPLACNALLFPELAPPVAVQSQAEYRAMFEGLAELAGVRETASLPHCLNSCCR